MEALTMDSESTQDIVAYGGMTGRYSRQLVAAASEGPEKVWLAVDRAVGREVEIRELRLPAGATPEERRRAERAFLREARLVAKLDHPVAPPVHEMGRRTDGAVYVVSRPQHGPTLTQALALRRRTEDRLALLVPMLGVCQLMAHAHNRGIAHRALGLAQVRIGAQLEPTVIGWRLARSLADPDGERVDPRDDVRVLGEMLQAILGGIEEYAPTVAAAAERACGASTCTADDLVRALQGARPRRRWLPRFAFAR